MSISEVGIDIGGTFTDVVRFDSDGSIYVRKVPSTPAAFADGFATGLGGVGVAASAVGRVVHGTTVATNALIARCGARVALVTNRGFRDVLTLRRGARAQLFNLWWVPPEPLVSSMDTYEIDCRIGPGGEVVKALSAEEVKTLGAVLAGRAYEAVAICYLHSYMNGDMERETAGLLAESLPNAFICTSCDVWPEILEYERTSTTAVNAYLGPLMQSYLSKVQSKAAAWGLSSEVMVCSSTGGLIGAVDAGHLPVRTIASGPSAGVVGAIRAAADVGEIDIITFDMGGTSLDVAVATGGEPARRDEWEADDGTVVRTPSIAVVSVGAGGGSVARVDEFGGLRVGPESAGADPGPACYGRGGQEPTTTDACLVLGIIGEGGLLGGDLPLERRYSEEALRHQVGIPLKLESVEQAAEAVFKIATHNMVEALRGQTIYRGRDPRDFCLVAYGGAGPMFAALVAKEAGIRRVLVPPRPGLLCALGLLQMPMRHEAVQSLLLPLSDETIRTSIHLLNELAARVRNLLMADGAQDGDVQIVYELELRYFGTDHVVSHRLDARDWTTNALQLEFEAAHQAEYGYVVPRSVATIEVVTCRTIGTAVPRQGIGMSRPKFPSGQGIRGVGERPVWLDGRWLNAKVIDRDSLACGDVAAGPCILEQSDTTTLVPCGMQAMCAESGTVVIETLQHGQS